MARKLITGNSILSFEPKNGVIVLIGSVPISKLLLIHNATKNISIFNFSDPNIPATSEYNAELNQTTITVSYDTSEMNSDDVIQVYYEKEELEIKPSRTYRDPVSKLRVSNPQTLIDTDFEYGSQPTKWETVKLVNNVPTSYSSPFTENSIRISSINVFFGDNLMTVTTEVPHNLPIGGVVEIVGLTDSQYEGTFIVKLISELSFSVRLPFRSNKSENLSTIYSTAYKGSLYTGSLVPVNDVTTSAGTASTLTVTTNNLHGFKPDTKLYLKNSRATKKFTFNVPDDVVGSGVTYHKSEISGLGGTGEIEYYNNNKIIAEEFIGKNEINVPDTAIDTSTGEVTYDISNQLGEIVNAGISTDNVLIFYTPAGNSPITRPGTPSPTNVRNFTPFRVLSCSSDSGITTVSLGESFDSSLKFIPDSNGSTDSFGNHRFIKGYRVVEFKRPNTIVFDQEVDFLSDGTEKIIITTNNTDSYFDNTVGAYITRNNGEYSNPNSLYAYFIYKIDSVSEDKKTITVSNDSVVYYLNDNGYRYPYNAYFSTQFYDKNVKVSNAGKIWAACSVRNHPLSNALHLTSVVGFSTDSYDDYQLVTYQNTNSKSKLLPLTNNRNYILQKVRNKKDWYRIYVSNNSDDFATNWNYPIKLYFNPDINDNGSKPNVLTVGIHTITSTSIVKNKDSIYLERRGGLDNNALITYNSNVTPIQSLVINDSYNIKIEDPLLDSDRIRLSKTTESVGIYGVTFDPRYPTRAYIYVYDLEDRINFNSNADNGIKLAGIIPNNFIQVTGIDFPNPIKNKFFNNIFKIKNITNYTSVPKQKSTSPTNTSRYVYSVEVEIPSDRSFNTFTYIYTMGYYSADVFNNGKVTSIVPLNTPDSNNDGNIDAEGEHILTQNIDGAVDDIYRIENPEDRSFIFNTISEIPEITKNISPFLESGAKVNFTNIIGQITVLNNNSNLVTLSLPTTDPYTFTTNIARTDAVLNGSFTVTFQMPSYEYGSSAYDFTVGISPLRTNNDYSSSTGITIYQYSGDYYGSGRRYIFDSFSRENIYLQPSPSGNDIYKISYDENGKITVYENDVAVYSSNITRNLSFLLFVYYYSYYNYNLSVKNISFGNSGPNVSLIPGETNYLKISSHNFADGAKVKYQVEPETAKPISPLVHNQEYYVRVLDGNYVGLATNIDDAVNRTIPLVGFTSTGNQTATHKLITNSVKGFIPGRGNVAITTSSPIVRGNNTNFLTDFTNGDMFRVYKLSNTNKPGEYFESKISSIKGDAVLKLENIPTFESSATNYFKETGLYVISDGKIIHRPFDGGVLMYSGLTPNSKVIRQTRRYFRYQSGKGIQVSMAINFNPTYDIDFIEPVGLGLTSTFKIKSKFPHKLSEQSPDTPQKIKLFNIVGTASTYFNNKNNNQGFPIVNVNDDYNFTIDIGSNILLDNIIGFPQFNVNNWQDSSIKCGLFDDQNGFFFEYDGKQLYAVRRSSTQQLSGQFKTERNSHLVEGINSVLTKQVKDGDYVVIRGQTYKIISVINDRALSVQPSYRGNSSKDIIISKVIDTKVPQSQWNIDKMDGTGESGYKIDISKIQMVYMDYSWYGAGSIRFGFKDQFGEVKYAHEFIHNNIFTESYFRSGNLPARYEVETFDRPLYSPALSHWGVSVIMDGRYDDDKAYLFTAESKTLPFTNDSYSSSFNGIVTLGSDIMTDITAQEYSQLVVGQELVQQNSYTNISRGTKILSLEIDTNNRVAGSSIRYKIKMSKPAIAGNNTNITLNAFSGTSSDLQKYIPLVSIRLAPSVDNGNIGNLGFRDIINRMQLTLKSAGVLTTHDCEVQLILNGKLSNEEFESVTSPSLSQVYKHEIGETITEGIPVFAFRAQGGSLLVPSTTSGLVGRRSLSGTEVSLDELALLGNSILGGDGTFPDGPDILTLAVKPIDTSTIGGSSPMIITGRITWAEAQA